MSKSPKTLFLLDAYALIYRAHFVFSNPSTKYNPINSRGMNTGVPYGFTNSLLEILQKQKPSHIAVVFDTSAPTFRHEEYEEYKATRQETPEDIKTGIPWVKEIVNGFNIKILEMDGYEADDIIGTIAKKAAKKGFEVFMMTPDKDFSQLVNENIYLYKPAYMGNAVDILGPEEVKKKWEIKEVDQVRDILGLMGDSVDNIPGIPGVGPKTAVKFIEQYGSIEELIKHTEDLKGKQRENVEKYADQAILSKRLATINTEVPVDFIEDDFVYREPDAERLKTVLRELEFRTLFSRVFSEKEAKIPVASGQISMFESGDNDENAKTEGRQFTNISEETSSYNLITSEADRKSLISKLLKQKEIAFVTLSEGSDPMLNSLIAFSISFKNGEASYVPFPDDEKKSVQLLSEFKKVFESPSILKIGHDVKFDMILFRKLGVELAEPFFDLKLAHYLVDPETSHELNVLSENYLQYFSMPLVDLTESGKKPGDLRDTIPEKLKDFCCEKADLIFQLKKVLQDELKKEKVEKLYKEVEHPLLRVLAEMEFEGVKIDENTLGEMSADFEKKSAKVQKEIFDLAGEEFNIGSPKQLGHILFEKLELMDNPKKTKTGQYATGEEILNKLASQHKIVNKILDFREYQKLKSTYLDALPLMVNPYDNRIHTNYSQTVAATGRLSSINPNLQNIPIRSEKGRAIRKAFVPRDKNYVLLSADYSQIELRIMASFSEDKEMIKAFNEGKDIHAITASKIFKMPLEKVDADMRRMAKSANFGMIYGISAFGLSQNLNIPRKEAADIIESYFKEFKAVKNYMDGVITDAKKKEYVETILGRRRYLRDINSRNAATRGYAERNAINAPIQGSAADMIKIAMVKIQQWMNKNKLKSKMIMQVHDELVFDAHKDEVENLRMHVVELMQNAIKMKVPIEVETGIGKNWLEAH
jgi:DNA polymerase-1